VHTADGASAQGIADLTLAYNDAKGRTENPILIAGNLGGQTLAGGLYKSTAGLEISSGDLTLDGQGNSNSVWIFQMASTLETSAGRQVLLIGGAESRNIFWQVGSSAVLGSSSVFEGTIMADQSITLNTGAILHGRALARIAAVTLDSNVITMPSHHNSSVLDVNMSGSVAIVYLPADPRLGMSNLVVLQTACPTASCLVCSRGFFVSNEQCSACNGGASYSCGGNSRTGSLCSGATASDTQTCSGGDSSDSNRTGKIVGGVIGGFIGILLLILICCLCARRSYAKVPTSARPSIDIQPSPVASAV
jgi:hypothetical protein